MGEGGDLIALVSSTMVVFFYLVKLPVGEEEGGIYTPPKYLTVGSQKVRL